MRKRFLLIHNPFAGLRGHTLAHRTARALERAGASVVVVRLRGPDARHAYDDLLSKVQVEKFDAVLAAGGDGTVRALAAACANSHVPVGIIPMGTGNVLAHEIGLSRKPKEIAHVAMKGDVQEIYGASINGEAFFLMSGVGFDGDVIRNLNLNTKRRIGKLAYTLPIIRALLKKPIPFTIHVDGQEHETTWIVAANVSHYAGGFTIAQNASIVRPDLNVVLFKGQSRSERILELLALATGRLANCKTISIMPCQELIVAQGSSGTRNEARLPVEADGDVLGYSPVKIRAGTTKLNLIVPPTFARGLKKNDMAQK